MQTVEPETVDSAVLLAEITRREDAWNREWEGYLAAQHNLRKLKPGMERSREEMRLAAVLTSLLERQDEIQADKAKAQQQRQREM